MGTIKRIWCSIFHNAKNWELNFEWDYSSEWTCNKCGSKHK